MCKITLTEEDGEYRTCLVSSETPTEILRHFRINPQTKIVYMNGKILSEEKMNKPINCTGTVHLAVKDKTFMR